ncbi:LysR family transcriptional regulator [Petralouisia muris]|uniref:LysR family transcriptional regulator n=1 Tax=Petralouisia muris TaxID=3032872 RepID=A0AC61S066_9FIRM|nr:LysR family transcriptional regulator [Petralouisia muris]TGY97687.1 LysR family transcriptional regulator [Petralouisia muris]
MATLKQLKTFIAVAEYKKMSEAAKRLYISQPTVSQIISDLENEYQTRLFERFPKELKITPSGQMLLESAREIAASHEHLEQSMKHANSLRPLRIGATLTVGNTLMGSLVETLTLQSPDIDVKVFIDNTQLIEHRMIHNELDIALVEGIIVHQEIMTEPVLEDTLCIICGKGHPFAGRSSIAIEELRHQDFIIWEKGNGTRAIFENIMLHSHIPFAIKWECSGRCGIVDAVRHNLGLGVLSRRCAAEYEEKGDIFVCQIENVSMKRYFYLCYNHCRPVTSQMQEFSDLIKNME